MTAVTPTLATAREVPALGGGPALLPVRPVARLVVERAAPTGTILVGGEPGEVLEIRLGLARDGRLWLLGGGLPGGRGYGVAGRSAIPAGQFVDVTV